MEYFPNLGNLTICEENMNAHSSGCRKDEDKPITFPLSRMMNAETEENELEEEEEHNEKFNCLTSRVRACYLKNLEKLLLNNYEQCSKEERSALPFSREHITKVAEQLEIKALRSCMVVILYQRAMMRLTKGIKKHTGQSKLYRCLQEFINSNNGWQDQEVQTTEESFLTDGATQTENIDTVVIKSEPLEHLEMGKPELICSEAQPIPVLVSGVAISKPVHDCNAEQYNDFQSTSSQIANYNKENIIPPINRDKGKTYYKRNAKDSSSTEPKTSSPPKRPCLRVKHLSTLQKPVVAHGVIPPLPTVPLSEIMGDHISKMNSSMNRETDMGNQLNEAVPDIPLPPSPPPSVPAIQDPYEHTTEEDKIEVNLSMVFGQNPDGPCTSAPPPALAVHPPSPASSCDAPEQVYAEDESCSSPRMSIEERLALVFNIPSDTPRTSSSSQQQQRRKSPPGNNQRRMSIEERLEAVFRGETISDEEVQIVDGEDMNPEGQENQSDETIGKYDAVPQQFIAPAHVKLRFIELFGHESDGEEEDNEPPYKDKIARWVVECLMPYYRHRLIASRPLFKRLARHIADTVMLSKPLPDKSDVEDCVADFFNTHSCVSDERDIY